MEVEGEADDERDRAVLLHEASEQRGVLMD